MDKRVEPINRNLAQTRRGIRYLRLLRRVVMTMPKGIAGRRKAASA